MTRDRPLTRSVEFAMVDDFEHIRLLDEVCQAPGCYLLNGEHSPEETAACIERWLAAQPDQEVQR